MVGLLPLLLLRPYMGTFTLRMPRPITALGMASGGINWWVPYVAGDADGTLYEPDPHAANPIGRVPGRVLALRWLGGLGETSFVLAYAPPQGEERVELWRTEGGIARRVRSLGSLPEGVRPILAVSGGGMALGSFGGRRATVQGLQGRPVIEIALPEGVVGLAMRDDGEKGGRALVAAFASGNVVAYGAGGEVRWRRALPTRGRLLDFEGEGERAAWASDEAGGRAGQIELSDGKDVGAPCVASGVERARPLLSGQLLLVGERTAEARRHAAPWAFDSPVVAEAAGGTRVAVALADGTLTSRDPLRPWMRKGDAALLAP